MRKPRILIVEDNQELRDVEAAIFSRVAGYEIECVRSVSTAIAAFLQQPPDLVILDLVLPEIDGWGFVESPVVSTSDVPIVVITGLARASPPSHLRHRLSGYLIKPFAVPRLLSGCTHVLAAPTHLAAGRARRHLRRTFLADATIRAYGSACGGLLHDVADCGFRIHCDDPLPLGSLVKTYVHLPWSSSPAELTGRVRWRNVHLHGLESALPIGYERAIFGDVEGHA